MGTVKMGKRLLFDEDEYQYIVEMVARTTIRTEKPCPDEDVLDRVKEIWVYNGTFQNVTANTMPNEFRRDVVKEMLTQIEADYGANSLAYLAKSVGQLEQLRFHGFMETKDIVKLFLETQPDITSNSASNELFWYNMIESVRNMRVNVQEKHYCGVTFPITDESINDLRTAIVGKTAAAASHESEDEE